MSNFWSTRYQQVDVESPPATLLKSPKSQKSAAYEPTSFLTERHACTDPLCALVFALCMGMTLHILAYAYQHGDPRKIYHGMDYEGKLCGVDLPFKPYVYWCAKGSRSAANTTADTSTWKGWRPVTDIDFHHPICVEFCPESPATKSVCYDADTQMTYDGIKTKLVADYATHPVSGRYCLPQSGALLDKLNGKLAEHQIDKYVPMVVSAFRNDWQLLLVAVCLAFGLSFLFLLAVECLAGVVMWFCSIALVIFPGAIGASLIYAHFNGGVDGIPHSGDAQTDLQVGIACCTASAFFLLVFCCMAGATSRAVRSVESAAACMFDAKSLLIEPVLNLATRAAIWAVMFSGFAWLISVGHVQKSKVYRTFTYTVEEWAYLVFYVVMMVWLNDFCNAVSQYVIANATSRWYFTEHVGGMKLVPRCLLCKGYASGFIYHFGSLALGSFVISLTRPFRMLLLVVLFAGEVTDNATCGCLSKGGACCRGFFERFLMHLSKNAYIEMAMTSKSFFAAGKSAAQMLATENKSIAALTGATWLFTLTGLATVTSFGAFITSFLVQNVSTFNSPSSKHYVQDPMVVASLAGVICFCVALGFMLVFDSVADTMLVCLAYDLKDQRENPLPPPKLEAATPQQSLFNSFFCSSVQPGPNAVLVANKRPQYIHDKLQELLDYK